MDYEGISGCVRMNNLIVMIIQCYGLKTYLPWSNFYFSEIKGILVRPSLVIIGAKMVKSINYFACKKNLHACIGAKLTNKNATS